MNTIRELKQEEKYKNMLKRKNKEKNIYKTQNETLRIKYEGIKKLLEKKDKEIERVNNIINELEKMMKNDLECARSMNENVLFNGAIDILEVYLDKLRELKGSDKE